MNGGADGRRRTIWAPEGCLVLRSRQGGGDWPIIGRNGAGQIDAAQDPVPRINAGPTEGYAEFATARVGAVLLESGATGFHPELDRARNNIYLKRRRSWA